MIYVITGYVQGMGIYIIVARERERMITKHCGEEMNERREDQWISASASEGRNELALYGRHGESKTDRCSTSQRHSF